MKNDNEISTGAAILIAVGILLVFGWILTLFEPKCSYSGCDNKQMEDSSYCGYHDLFRTPTYRKTYSDVKTHDKDTTTSSDSSYNSSHNKKNNNSNSSWESYDEGYDAIYDDDDYDWDRYNSDPDYASGVDDAMDELDW